MVGFLTITSYCKFTTECGSERVLKIGQFSKSYVQKNWWLLLFGALCIHVHTKKRVYPSTIFLRYAPVRLYIRGVRGRRFRGLNRRKQEMHSGQRGICPIAELYRSIGYI